MKAFIKPAIVLGMAGALALGSMTPSQARFRPWVAAGIGLAAGAAFASAAAANSAYYYGYGPGYYDYGYAPGYDAYAYEPYDAPAPVYQYQYGPYVGGHRYPEQTRERTLRRHDY